MKRWLLRLSAIGLLGAASTAVLIAVRPKPVGVVAGITQQVPAAGPALAFIGSGFAAKPVKGRGFTAAPPKNQPEELRATAPEKAAGRFEVGRERPWRPVRFSLPNAGTASGTNEAGTVTYRNAYPGVDVVTTRAPEHVELAFVVRNDDTRPNFRMRFDGEDKLAYEPKLERLEVTAPNGEVRLAIARPKAFDSVGAERSGSYRVEGRDVVVDLDLRGMTPPVFVDPLLYIPTWTLLSDARQPGATTYLHERLSRETQLTFDEGRQIPVLARPIRSQQREDGTMHFGTLWHKQLTSVQQAPRTPSLGFASNSEQALQEWKRVYGSESELWERRQGRWQLGADTGLPGLIDAAFGFDAARGRLVAFGGGLPAFTSQIYSWGYSPARVWPSLTFPWDATYERVGSEWRATRVLNSPVPRLRATMAGFGDGVVLFGGRALEVELSKLVQFHEDPPSPDNLATDTLLNDTWSYNGSAWKKIPSAYAPPPQEGAKLIRDTRRNRLVLVSGSTGTRNQQAPDVSDSTIVPSDDFALWEFDGTEWLQRFAPGDATLPPELRNRRGVSAAWHPVRQTVILFGGFATKQPSCTRPGLFNLRSTADLALRAQLEAEGCMAGWVHDFWEWNGESLRQLSRAAFAGYSGSWALYRQVAGAVPGVVAPSTTSDHARPSKLWPWRYDQRASHFHLRTTLERAYTAPGSGATSPNTVSGTAAPLPGAPPAAPTFVSPFFYPQASPQLAYDPAGGKFLVSAPEGRWFETNLETWTENAPASPFEDGINDFFAATWDTVANRVVLFDPVTGKSWQHRNNGWTTLPLTADLAPWTIDPRMRRKQNRNGTSYLPGLNTSIRQVGPKLPRLVFDRERRVAVLLHNDTLWELTDSTWQPRQVPPGLKACDASTLMAYDGARRRVVVVGCKLPAATWEWDGAQWFGPFAAPYLATVTRPAAPGLPAWTGPIQLSYAHQNAIAELPALGGVGTVDYDGTLRIWNGVTWANGPKLAEGPLSDAAKEIKEAPASYGTPSNYGYLTEYAVPLSVYPPLVEDTATSRVLAFRDGPRGLREIDLQKPEAERAWGATLAGRYGVNPPLVPPQGFAEPYVHPHPLELWSPEQVTEDSLCDPAARYAQTGTTSEGVEKSIQALFWSFRLLSDPLKKRTMLLTHRGALWQLGAESVRGIGDACTTVADCGVGVACVRGKCSAGDYGNVCDSNNDCDNNAACIDGVCCNNRSCVLACNTCVGSRPGYCEAIPAGMPDPKLRYDKNGARCDGQQCGKVCPGNTVLRDEYQLSVYLSEYNNRPACIFPTGPRSCGPTATCNNGQYQAPGACTANTTTCVTPAATTCAGGLGCFDATRCRVPGDPQSCTTRADCRPFEACNPTTHVCQPDAVSAVATQRGITPSSWDPPVRNTPQDIANMLIDAGFEADEEGRIRFDDFAFGGIKMGFDPNLKNPVIGFRHCLDRIQSCAAPTGNYDECVAAMPRCRSGTPWQDDPAGFDCCPEECLLDYFQARATKPPGRAAAELTRSTCYPGIESYVQGTP